ncbi:aminotransferase class V-fold PLP-dependent enzyme [Schlegelella sp. S2-27]|uniref:Aminotransferase class V-fold PLP-dependent enzyme n=1 Tax=Caldimonas mangrovi TaxID=2944811 RepID=A0ABT0YNI0_9BURK|nr:aminotransferase class V-fold PLP-dependent enzyme [Caldimonas mangrovi]MCM5679979.1 aminotransferase class V-fold PLP-dependent enzyme [Caldimonas mangrovi]
MNSLHDTYGLTPVINAAGSYTPVGVSRSTRAVADVVGESLTEFFVIEELQAAAGAAIARYAGAEAATVMHCAAAGITMAIAGVMAGVDAARIAALPDATGLPHKVVLPAGHAVDYGHPIVTDIRLAGATPVLAGTEQRCTLAELEQALAAPDTACLLLVASRLVKGEAVDLTQAVAAAHRRGVPALIDGAAQDLRIPALLATGADAVIISAQKYLAAPTAGLVVGRTALVQAAHAQEKGIGRAMKATKEALLGCLAAIGQRERLDVGAWQAEQDTKVAFFVERAARLPGLQAQALQDPAGMPFSRAVLSVDPAVAGRSAATLLQELREGSPSIWVMGHEAGQGRLVLEFVPLRHDEIVRILARLQQVLQA